MSKICGTKFIFTVLVAAVGCGFQHGFQMGLTNIAEKAIIEWLEKVETKRLKGKNVIQEIGTIWKMISAIFQVGACVGALLTGYFGERYGRKRSLYWNNFLILGAVGFMLWSKQAGSPEMLIAGRFIAGINAGLNSGICPMYLVEIAPDEIRGLIGGLFPVFIDFGILVSFIAGLLLGTSYDWPTMFMIPLIPASLQVICLLVCPESPKHLVIGNDNEIEAEKALQWLKGEEDVSKYMKEIFEEDNLVKQMHATTLKRLFSDIKLRTPLLICIMLSLGHQFCGINSVLFFSKNTFAQLIGAESSSADILSICIPVVMMTGDAICISLVDRVGRRKLLLISFMGMALDTIAMTITMNVAKAKPLAQFWTVSSIMCHFVFIICFSAGLGTIPRFLTAELFNHSTRPVAVSIAENVKWLASLVVSETFLPLKNVIGYYVLAIFIVLNLFFFIFCKIYLPESAKLSAKAIMKLFDYLE